jgi:hypothetical protein
MHSRYEVERVLSLVAEGWNDCQISRATEINRTTIREWRHQGPPGRRWYRDSRCFICDGNPLDEPAYSYLLGIYLGDGYISKEPRTYRLRISQDQRYPELINLARSSIARVLGGDLARVGVVRCVGCVAVSAHWSHWPCLFPQHGPGRKHQRPIVLADWQSAIVQAYPRQLLRGLIHSDGCRVINRVWGDRYRYPRYLFTNTSKDILQIFRDACDAIGVEHRNSKPDTISVARRNSVASVDAFIGPKA